MKDGEYTLLTHDEAGAIHDAVGPFTHEHAAAVCLLNYNGVAETRGCIENVVSSVEPESIVIVLDNASREDDAAALNEYVNGLGAVLWEGVVDRNDFVLQMVLVRSPAGRCPCLMIRSNRNLGFCAGYNLLVDIAAALRIPYALILNNDARIDRATVPRLMATAAATGAAAVSPVILDSKGQIWYSGAYRYWAGYRYLKHEPTEPKSYATEVHSGCAVLFDVRFYVGIGGMAPSLFICLDEPECAARIAARGGDIVVEPAARVIHRVGGTLGRHGSPLHDYFWVRNRYLYSELTNSKGKHIAFLASYTFLRVAKWAYYASRGEWQRIGPELRAVHDYARRRFGPGSLAQRIGALPASHPLWRNGVQS